MRKQKTRQRTCSVSVTDGGYVDCGSDFSVHPNVIAEPECTKATFFHHTVINMRIIPGIVISAQA
jgi:hypothetical protein